MIGLKKLKKGNYIVHENEPCLIKEIEFKVYGTHSHTKAKLTVENIFSGKTYVLSMPLGEQLQEADIIRKCATIISKTDEGLQIMDLFNFETIDAKADKELLEQAQLNDQVTYIQFNNASKVIDIRKQSL